MVHYRLTYFNLGGLAEVSRLILSYANVDFEDERIDRDDWKDKLKPNQPYESLPVLTIDGSTRLPQSLAIARYLGNEYGLGGADKLESAFLDSIADMHRDFFLEIIHFLHVRAGTGYRDGDKDQLYNETFVPAIKRYAPYHVRDLKKTNSGYYGKHGITWVDLFVAPTFAKVHEYQPEVLDDYPEIVEHYKRVYAHPNLQKYLSTKPHTPI